ASAPWSISSPGAQLAINPAGAPLPLSSVTLNPTSVVGGNPSTGTVTLTAPAPAGGAVVTLASTGAVASVPASVTVPAGATSATFTITTPVVMGLIAQSDIIATFGGVSRAATLTVTPSSPHARPRPAQRRARPAARSSMAAAARSSADPAPHPRHAVAAESPTSAD